MPGGDHAETWPAEWRAVLPATVGRSSTAPRDAGGTLSSLDYAHPVFELFNAPRSGDFSTARFYRYRTLTPAAGATARRDSTTARRRSSSRRVGSGKVVVWASTLDAYWTNLPLQPVFLPFVHQLGKHVGRYADARPWFVAGEVLDLSRHGELTAPFTGRRERPARASSCWRRRRARKERVTATGPNHLVTLREQGFYELRGPETPVGSWHGRSRSM